MRAAYKAVVAGKQVAVVVPTTVLARQHYESFIERFEETAVRIGSLSRFNSTEENKKVVAGISSGRIDIVVGTHRVLQRDIAFSDLGLAIIDEEHRFGVAHKERLKRFRSTIDVLTLSATPIPRTLHMSLVGIRDLSLIETAPANRQVIRTYLAEYEESVVREAILREMSRKGQVFFIHNRVQSIELVAAELQELVPEARIGIGHGQMKQGELEKIMNRFVSGDIDVLVSTTIVESGLDIPNANTIIIRSAEHFGLAELYQLRGRVGRSSRRAYAYLLISNPTSLSKDARKRLEVLQSLDDLGVGFKLALQDMEIRGAGNLLGKDQSGHINLIGYELYSKILKDAIEQLKSSEQQTELEIQLDPEIKIGFPTHIPPSYLPDVGQRLLLYQRLIEISHEHELHQILEEISDRFGQPPIEVESLFEYMALRCFAKRHLLEVVRRSANGLFIKFHEQQEVNQAAALRLVKLNSGVRLTPGRAIIIDMEWDSIEHPGEILKLVSPIIKELADVT
ncbi:UNVERIFIED_CONTAM: hypothetical protein GTU68_047069 [Idotea baltica]|nr:hypothetical protein [Idotea baltica]